MKAKKNRKRSTKVILTTDPHGEHDVRLIEQHPDGIGNSLYALKVCGKDAIGFTGEELTSLAWQWLNHAGELYHEKRLAIMACAVDRLTIVGRRKVAATAKLVRGHYKHNGVKL